VLAIIYKRAFCSIIAGLLQVNKRIASGNLLGQSNLARQRFAGATIESWCPLKRAQYPAEVETLERMIFPITVGVPRL
jgi:hypothetical protein